MSTKALLILVDGMRSDSLEKCGNPWIGKMMENGSYTLSARTVMPSVTLPCHMSLFHSVEPQRHGITTNLYIPPVRPIAGLCEQLKAAGKTGAFFYNWEELRDLARPDSISYACFVSGHTYGYRSACERVTACAVEYLRTDRPDFAFLYLGYPDAAGHNFGWMTPEYLESVDFSWCLIETAVRSLPEEYSVIVTADHGGHERTHGTPTDEDMTIPMLFMGDRFAKGHRIEHPVSIHDIAPTVAGLLGVPVNPEWEGKCIL